jgi:hypothetical protein
MRQQGAAAVNIRTFQQGDEVHQVAIYNEAAGGLPKFKPASTQDVLRRVTAKDFDPSMKLFAVDGGQPVAYGVLNANGRVSYPWCCPGFEALAEPMFDEMIRTMKQRGFKKVFAAYRGDWSSVLEFFQQHGFQKARDMVNYVLDVVDTPTVPARRTSNVSPLERSDVPALCGLAPHTLRCRTAQELEQHLFNNAYFAPESLFALRGRTDKKLLGAGILVTNPTYADPKMVDAAMPCFRLGAFGTEGMQTKRIKGLFSFLCRDEAGCGAVAVELMAHAANLLQDSDDISALAGQVPSDAPHLMRFYQTVFRRQGSFPVLERDL